jgi:hypothetical protein
MPRPQRFCIFCGKPGLTKEHVWADWLKQHIPKQAINHTQLVAILHPTHSEFRRKTVAGDLRSRRLRVVCERCNTGWMSQLQSQGKPYLLPLIRGEVTALNPAAQTTVAAWIAMFVMVAEHFNPHTVVSTKTERKTFRHKRTPSSNWKIWIGDYEQGNWPGLLARFVVPIRAPHHVPKPMDNGLPRPNTQTASFLVGRLYVHARSSTTDVFENWRLVRSDMLAQIWPVRRNVVGWPTTITLTDRDADGIANSFHVVAKRIAEESGIWLLGDFNL